MRETLLTIRDAAFLGVCIVVIVLTFSLAGGVR